MRADGRVGTTRRFVLRGGQDGAVDVRFPACPKDSLAAGLGRLRPVGMGTKRQILTLDSLSNRDADRQARVGV